MDGWDVDYARSGDLSIAYTAAGEGPELVLVPGFVSNIDGYEDVPPLAHIMRRFAGFSRFVTFDKRGTGLSDRSLGLGSIEDRMDDLRAVVDAVEFERPTIVGYSEGGPLALVYATTYPDRVGSLVLWGTFARVRRDGAYGIPEPEQLEEEKSWLDMVERDWGTGTVFPFFLAGLGQDEAQTAAVARYERQACTPRAAREILRSNIDIDVRPALAAVSVPTLVIHRTGDPLLPVEHGRYLAENIREARLHELPGEVHVPGHVGGDDEVLDLIEEFVTGESAGADRAADRMLTTLMFTDIVDSTRRAAELGDRRWRELLDRHDEIARREFRRGRGDFVKHTGDGMLAMFDGPGRAIGTAETITEAVRGIRLEVRSGLHTGEVELRGDDVGGIGVHIAARVSALADGGQVLVSNTVKDLVIGSGIDFTDHGSHELEGVPGEWSLWAAA